MIIRKIILVGSLFLLAMTSVAAQKVLQLEKYGHAKTKKIYIGELIHYKLQGDEVWYSGYIEDIKVEDNLLVMKDRYVDVSKIEKMRRPLGWSKPARSMLYIFGASWSANALIGTLTDGNPDTRYGWGDVAVTASSWALGWLIPKIFRYKTLRFGKSRRLRVLDLSPPPGGPPIKV